MDGEADACRGEQARGGAQGAAAAHRRAGGALCHRCRAEGGDAEEAQADACGVGTADFANGVRALHRKFVSLRSDFAALKDEAYRQRKTIGPDIQQFADMVRDKVEEESERTEAAVAKYRVAMQKNKKLYNKLQEMRGNIRVYCRTRPLSEAELGAGQIMAATAMNNEEIAVVDTSRGEEIRKIFKFDRVYGPGTKQDEVFQDTKPLVTSVLDGYNVCIFAYGQTGSGKTYTMEGPPENPGINKRTLQELFRIADERSEDYDISITVSNMEIYNENIYDLLAEPPAEGVHSIQARLDIRMGAQGIDVPGLVEETCSSLDDVLAVIQRGAANRSTFATDMNEHSSRSHAILRIVARCQNKISRIATVGKLSLVDLAGSERVAKSGVTAERLKEAQNINRSLSALGDVIQSLTAKNKAHIPYRNSKLTFLLADSLGGDSKTLMFVQVAPGSYNAPETICSLTFAARVRSVKLQLASVHTESPELSEYKDMVAKLQAKLAAAGSAS
ncbi:microtubule-based motor protein [Thecamonas trahens ATCC 50062]|uniref:Kinesin-like protein n=1 Tax=Thecamonas trahens ATCC 50062 TaxID=461836 RepID=A0A0L0DI79_THETB|nr:microtubule-based motor protein [Thecamonas trahens ATCC 50062]KNC52017.1 microtubule-based motor protein [Thecamonas trahens ATCC 50062]|eukprot:XP_013755600.1 microtubule-based motor protein [Thecamonas trahens ATCC 50062]